MAGNKKRVHINKLNMVISIVVAFAAWLYVVYNISPTTVKTYREVPVAYIGEDELAEKGLGVQSASVETITVKVRIKRIDSMGFSSDDISVTADVSDMGKGDAEIAINVSTPQGVSVERTSHTRTTVKTALSNNRDVPVSAEFAAASEEAREPIASQLSFDEVSVIGAKSVVDKVAYVALVANEESIGADGLDVYAKPVAYDVDGKAIKHIVVLPAVIEGHVAIATVKKVSLKLSVIDESNDGCSRTYTVPQTIYIKGPATVVTNISEVAASVNITGLTQSHSVKLNYSLPEGVQLANRSLNTRLKLTVK